MRLGREVVILRLAPGLHNRVVGLRCPRGYFIAGEIRHARQRQPQLLVELRGNPVQLLKLFLQLARLIHHGRSFVVLAGFLKRAHLLAQLIAPRLQPFRRGDGLPPALIENTKIPQQRGRVGAPRAEFLFHKFQVVTDKSKVEHRSTSLPDQRQLPAASFQLLAKNRLWRTGG